MTRLASLALLLIGCQAPTFVAHCVPGEQRACGCPSGVMGAQTCGMDGTFAECVGCPRDAGPIDAWMDAATGPCAHPIDCAAGYDCALAHPTDTMPSCYARTYAQPASGGFGTDCAATALGCTTVTSPCAPGFDCEASLACDPNAVCTRACTADTDCPPTMFCGVGHGGSQRCLTRTVCSPCVIDEQCGVNVCATDARGERFCAHPCRVDDDCPLPYTNSMTGVTSSRFERCVADPSMPSRSVCRPVVGSCHGPSALAGFPDRGVCSWCRIGIPDDCAAMARCLGAETGEHLCVVGCSLVVDAAGNAGADTCPTGSHCVVGTLQGPATLMGVCTADPMHQQLTCYP
jgi:hypothetical protein